MLSETAGVLLAQIAGGLVIIAGSVSLALQMMKFKLEIADRYAQELERKERQIAQCEEEREAWARREAELLAQLRERK
jgi:hypothetical protein